MSTTNHQRQHEVDVVQIHADATLAELMARLEVAVGPVVALVFGDDEFPLHLTETLPWMALKRKATQRGLRLVVVAPHVREARHLGAQAGIPAAGSLADAARMGQHSRPLGGYPMGLPQVWPGQGRAEAVRDVRQRLGRTRPVARRPQTRAPVAPWLSNLALFFWLLVMTALLGLTVVALVPSAEVVLTPERQPIHISVPMSANINTTRTDFVNQVIPARSVVVDVEGVGEITPTGRRQEPDARATGTVTFTNRRAQSVTIPAGTIVATSSGTNLRFQTTQDASLPPGIGATATVPIEAMSPGPVGNVRAFLINSIQGPLSLVAQVVNETPTSGGTLKEVRVVTQADKDNLLQATERQLQEEAQRRLVDTLAENEFVPPETIGTLRLSENFDHFVDEPADTLQVRLRIRARGLAVDGTAAQSIAQSRLQELVPAEARLLSAGLSITPGPVTSASLEAVSFAMNASAQYVRPLPVEEIRDTLYRVPIDVAASLLMERYAIASVQKIEVAPAWYAESIGLLPILPARIYVQVNYAP